MAFVFRFVGLVFIAGMLAAAVVDATKSIAASSLTVTSVGQWWFSLSRTSLDATRQIVQGSIDPHIGGWLWDPVIQTLLSLPTWLALGVPGAVLIAIAPTARRSYTGRISSRIDGGLT